MFLQTAIILGLTCNGLANTLGLRRDYAVKDSHVVPRGWIKVAKAPADHVIKLRIGLEQGRFDELEEHLYQVSDPSHARYGAHLSAAEVAELVKPSDESLNAVHEWLADHAIDTTRIEYTPAMDWINIDLPVSAIERLLDTEYHAYEKDGDVLVRAPEWSLPSHLHRHIADVQPTSSFFRAKRQSKQSKGMYWKDTIALEDIKRPTSGSSVAEVCNATLVTPLCLRTLYGTINYKVQSAGKNYMALNDFLGEINNRSDAEIYFQMFRPDAVNAAFQFSQISIAGGTVQQTPENVTQINAGTGIEGDLDMETMLGIAWPVPLTIYSTGGLDPSYKPDMATPTNSDEPYVTWLQYITSLPDDALPSIISTSYGDDEQTVSRAYATQTCNMIAQLGARGVSVLFSSGDEGVGFEGDCFTNDGKNTSTFLPAFPAGCPYVTAVGATKNFFPEVAALDARFSPAFTSGGGFSNYFPRPAYQASAVSNYLKKYIKNEYAGLYNPSGRGYPDIAAQGQNFSTVWDGAVRPVDGTSCASPTAAGVLALVNDALIAAGKSPLGFLNPWLYGGGYKAFNDIKSGSSAGCSTPGFPAEVGWDAVTGFGTPHFPEIVKDLGLDVKC